MNHNLYLELATELAKTSTVRQRVGAIVVSKSGVVLGSSANSYKTHPYQAELAKKTNNEHKIYLHAEVAALLKSFNSGLKPYRIYIARVHKDDSTCISKPCPICAMAIELAGVKEIYYT